MKSKEHVLIYCRAIIILMLIIAFIFYDYSALAYQTGPHDIVYEGLWYWPVSNGSYYISSGVQLARELDGTPHHGIDIANVNTSTDVRAARAGVATFMGGSKDSSRGLWVVIDHEDGYYTDYQHLDSVIFNGSKVNRVGESIRVEAGDCIGKCGKTGAGVTGYHLHFEVVYCTKGAGYTSEYDGGTWENKWGTDSWKTLYPDRQAYTTNKDATGPINATTLEFHDVVYPKAYTINSNGWNVRSGLIISNESLKSIKSIITRKSDGVEITSPVEITFTNAGKAFALSTIDSRIKFSDIKNPGTYIWTLVAIDNAGRELTLDMEIEAKASGQTETATIDSLIYNDKYPIKNRVTEDSVYILSLDGTAIAREKPYVETAARATYVRGDLIHIIASVENDSGNKWYETEDHSYISNGDVTLLYTVENKETKRYTVVQSCKSYHYPFRINAMIPQITNLLNPAQNEYSNGNSITAVATVTGWQGLSWYQLEDGSFILAENCATYAPPPTISGTTIQPPNTISNGQYVNLSCTVNSQYTLTKINGIIKKCSTGETICDVSVSPNSTSYTIGGETIDYGLKFNDSRLNNSYCQYILRATYNKNGVSCTKTLVDKYFVVGNGTVSTVLTPGVYQFNTDDEARSGPAESNSIVKSYATGSIIFVESVEKNAWDNFWLKLYDGSYVWSGDADHVTFEETAHSGTYAFIQEGTAKKYPYQTSPDFKSYGAGATISVNAQVFNTISEKWYKLSDGSWVYSGIVQDTEYSEPLPDIPGGNCGDNITWTLNQSGQLTISGTGTMFDYWYPGAETPFYSNADIKSVIICEGITSIGSRAFYGCSNLTSVSIPKSVKSIGYEAFSHCTSLPSINLPYGITKLDVGTFDGCEKMENIVIPDTVTGIEDIVFRNCYKLSSIDLPDSLEYIGYYTFGGCIGLTSIDLPTGLKSIGSYAFTMCTGLTSFSIPDQVTSIDEYTFCRCNNLKTMSIPIGVTSIDDTAFISCDNMTIEGTSGSYAETFAKKNAIPFVPLKIDFIPDFILPSSLTTIDEMAFAGTNVSCVKLPDGITSIGSMAFADCTHLAKIYIPKATTMIASDAFSGVENLIIFGEAGSYAQTFAKNHNYRFIQINGDSTTSDWVLATNVPENAEIVNTKTQYSFRDRGAASYSEWSTWSAWTESKKTITDSSLMQEESKTQCRWWAAKCFNCGHNNPYHGTSCKTCGAYLDSNKDGTVWTSAFAYSDDTSGTSTILGRSQGRYFDGEPYWNEYKQVTAYRYRTRELTYSWSGWSAWSDTPVTVTETRQVQTRTMVQYLIK